MHKPICLWTLEHLERCSIEGPLALPKVTAWFGRHRCGARLFGVKQTGARRATDPLLRAHRVCQITQAVDTKHELQSAPIFLGSNMKRAPWSSVGPRVPASCFHRGMGERRLEPRASTTRLVARFESKQKNVRLFVFAYRAGRYWLFERITRDPKDTSRELEGEVCDIHLVYSCLRLSVI